MKNRKLILTVLLSVLLIMTVLNLSCTIAAGGRHTVGIRPDGTVVATGNNDEGQCNVEGWTDIIHVAAGFSHTVGLKDDGTVVATGRNAEGQCNVAGWTNINMVVAGDWHTVGLKQDGTVVATGKSDQGQCDVLGWMNITQVAAGGAHTVGLMSGGTVVATGRNNEGQCNVAGWTNITQVAAGYSHTVGLREDGTVVATGNNDEGQCNVAGWTNITQVAAGRAHTVGLREDGTVVATGRNNEGQCEVNGWTNIEQVAAGGWHTVGLKDCGAVVATGSNAEGQCNVSGWILKTMSSEPSPLYHLTVSTPAGGLVTAPGEGTFAYCEGDVINLIAEPDACFEFVEWTGDVDTIADVHAASTNITMDGDYFIAANFAKIRYNLTTNSTDGGAVTTPGEGTFPYDCGTVVNLVAQAQEGYQFVSWIGDVGTIANVQNATSTITMNDNYSITASFEKKPSTNWLLIGAIIGAVVVIVLLIVFVRRK